MDLNNILNKKVEFETIFSNYGITRAYLFGSYSLGSQNENSDIDILFDYDQSRKFSLFDMEEVRLRLEKLFGKKVDFVPSKGVKSIIHTDIQNNLVKIYG